MNQLQTVLDALADAGDYIESDKHEALRQEAIAIVKQMMQADPVAWRYDLATYLEGDVRGRNWREAFSGQKPNMPWLTKDVTPLFPAPRAVPAWLPIESAPKDGTDILVMYMHIDTQIVHNAFWLGDEDYDTDPSGWWTYEHSEVSRLLLDDWMTPTHWMPLPAAPKGAV